MDDLLARAQPPPLTVSQVNARARVLLERNFTPVTVVGEISGHKIVGGHHYFTLKDAESQLAAVLFRREAEAARVPLENGQEIVATGRLTIYSQYGRYQMVIDRVEKRGAGALQAAFEALKARLAAEGLFAEERKRRLPTVPRRVAVVTSPTGAVIRDIVNVATRRWPRASLLVVPTRVQGAEAAPQVAAAIVHVSELTPRLGLDVLIVARGGGSLEDLWCFNDERVARAIAASAIPVVSAIGHETDFTIADFVADLRAPTPSAAAELVFPSRLELLALLERLLGRGRDSLRRVLERHRLHLRALKAELGDGRRLVREQVQRLDHAKLAATRAVQRLLRDRRQTLAVLEGRILRQHPRNNLAAVAASLEATGRRIALATRLAVRSRREWIAAAESRLRALSPLGVLERGYAIVQDDQGKVVRRHDEVRAGEAVQVRLAVGGLAATVVTTHPPQEPS